MAKEQTKVWGAVIAAAVVVAGSLVSLGNSFSGHVASPGHPEGLRQCRQNRDLIEVVDDELADVQLQVGGLGIKLESIHEDLARQQAEQEAGFARIEQALRAMPSR